MCILEIFQLSFIDKFKILYKIFSIFILLIQLHVYVLSHLFNVLNLLAADMFLRQPPVRPF